jgi:hypothetical protein
VTIDECMCRGCGNIRLEHDRQEVVCRRCCQKYPDALLKAVVDQFDYAMRLRTGEILYFSIATINGDFVHLEVHDIHKHRIDERPPCLFARGVDVRASDIVWCADAPWDS